MNATEFFAMGGYALYVWTSYGLALVILVLNLLAPLRRRNAVRRQLADLNRLRDEPQ